MERRKIKGWRSKLDEELQAARDDVWSFGADRQGARSAGSGLDFREKKDAAFDNSFASGPVDRRVNRLDRLAASARLAELVRLVAADRREAARRRASEWYHSRTKKQREDLRQKARDRRHRYRDRERAYARQRHERIRSDPELAAIEAEYRRDRWEAIKADEGRHAALLARRREARREKMAQLRADRDAYEGFLAKRREEQRAYREANRERYLAKKRREYQRRKAKGSDPA